MSRPRRVALWDAIHDYVRACGDPGCPASDARMDAVVAVERAVDNAGIAELHGQLGEWLNSGNLD